MQRFVGRVFQVAGAKALGQERASRPRKGGGEKYAEDDCKPVPTSCAPPYYTFGKQAICGSLVGVL